MWGSVHYLRLYGPLGDHKVIVAQIGCEYDPGNRNKGTSFACAIPVSVNQVFAVYSR